MQWFRDIPISKKLRLIIAVTAGLALLMEFGVSTVNNWTSQRQKTVENLMAQAKIIGANSTAALTFNDPKAAEENVGVLRNVPSVEYGLLFTKGGRVFAKYLRENFKEYAQPSKPLGKDGYYFEYGHLTVSQRIFLDNDHIGTIVVHSDLKDMYSQLIRNVIIVSLDTLLVAGIIVFLLSSVFERIISEPLQQLSKLMKDISNRKDYSVMATKHGEDEIGQLADSFNIMTEDLLKTTVSRDYVDSIIKNMIDSLIVTGPDGRIEVINKSTSDLLGYHEDELIGKPIGMILTEDIPLNSLGMKENIETIYLSKDGRKIPVLFSCSGMVDNSGQSHGNVCVASDITERKLHEKEKEAMQLKMFTTSKLASLGEIATGIAHEINQPLTYISSFIQAIQINLESNAIDKIKLQERLKIASKQIQRIIEIIQHLQTFGRQDDIPMQPVNIEEVFNNSLLLMGERIHLKNINLLRHIEPDLPMLSGNSTRLEQLFINLLQNSIDALPIETTDAMIKITMFTSEEKDSIVIKCSDNGMGIEQKNLERIFEPFFTTKEIGKGTGIGLSIVYGIVQEHNGVITCESETKKGTTFTITLPVKSDAKK